MSEDEELTCSERMETSWCCVQVGRISVLPEKFRVPLFTVMTCFLFLYQGLNSIAAAGYSIDIAETLPWRNGQADGYHINNTKGEKIHINVELYVGLRGTVHVTTLHDQKTGVEYKRTKRIKFTDDECIKDYCNDCHIAGNAAFLLVIISMCAALPALRSDCLRRDPDHDSNFAKCMGLLTGVGSGIAIMIAGLWFHHHCDIPPNHYEASTKSNMEVTWGFGVGVYCLIINGCILILDGLVHILFPVAVHVDTGYHFDEPGRQPLMSKSTKQEEIGA